MCLILIIDESQKKELEDILRGVKFTELVEEMGLNVTQKLKVTARQDSVPPPPKIAKKIATQVIILVYGKLEFLN